MSDQTWAVIAGAALVIVMRIIDWFLPRNRISRWASKHSVPAGDSDDDGERD